MKTKVIDSARHPLLCLKTVIRTRNFEASKRFYTQVLNLEIAEEYDDGNGCRGVIMRFGPEGSNAFLEISEITEVHPYYQGAFGEDFENDKADIKLKTDNVDYWAALLHEKWKARGPVPRPWGSSYLYLRDPDGLQIIIYQEKTS